MSHSPTPATESTAVLLAYISPISTTAGPAHFYTGPFVFPVPDYVWLQSTTGGVWQVVKQTNDARTIRSRGGA